jgi:hypothetical protein
MNACSSLLFLATKLLISRCAFHMAFLMLTPASSRGGSTFGRIFGLAAFASRVLNSSARFTRSSNFSLNHLSFSSFSFCTAADLSWRCLCNAVSCWSCAYNFTVRSWTSFFAESCAFSAVNLPCDSSLMRCSAQSIRSKYTPRAG